MAVTQTTHIAEIRIPQEWNVLGVRGEGAVVAVGREGHSCHPPPGGVERGYAASSRSIPLGSTGEKGLFRVCTSLGLNLTESVHNDPSTPSNPPPFHPLPPFACRLPRPDSLDSVAFPPAPSQRSLSTKQMLSRSLRQLKKQQVVPSRGRVGPLRCWLVGGPFPLGRYR